LSVVSVGSICLYFFFFFSSRRRHTRFSRDWSSDVCSSDLDLALIRHAEQPERRPVLVLDDQLTIGASDANRQLVLCPKSRQPVRSEERRVGKECGSRGGADH